MNGANSTDIPVPERRPGAITPAGALGVLLHRPRLYDLFVQVALIGREPSFRGQLLALARLRPGEAVLDVGCGTGSLALMAKEAVGAAGVVRGVDASAEMISWARRKARRAGTEVDFQQAPAQALPFGDATFDVVLCTLMLHHLSKKARTQLAGESRRVVRPGGRVLVVDFAEAAPRKGLRRHLHHRHGNVALHEILSLLGQAGLEVVASGPVGIENVHYALATVSAAN